MATLKHNPIEIDKDKPFANCKLQRQPYAEVLTDIVSNYADGFVLAINNEWGTGKTTFVKMWQKHLDNHEFQTLYFNAWENDFEDDVLVALLSELKELKGDKTEEIFQEVVKRAAPLAKKLLPSVAKALAKKYIGDEFVQELIEGAADVSAEGLEAELKSYTNRKQSIQSFRKSLEKFVEAADPDKPVVFILDELDRCRPNYAVRVLEQIKHIFSVSGIVFVLSIDKNQLGHAVRGVYGSESLNADEYLRRFIDLEYALPSPNTEAFIRYLCNYFRIDEFLNSEKRQNFEVFEFDQTQFIKTANLLAQFSKPTLRNTVKLFSHLNVTLRSFRPEDHVFPHVIFFLIFIRNKFPKEYHNIIEGLYDFEAFKTTVERIIPNELPRDLRHVFYDIEGILLVLYNNQSPLPYELTRSNNGKDELNFKSDFDYTERNHKLLSAISSFLKTEGKALDLKYLTQKIELTNPFS